MVHQRRGAGGVGEGAIAVGSGREAVSPGGYCARMPLLPGHERAVIPEAKLRYCLDPMHPTGRDKARVFSSALGLDLRSTATLERMLREGISVHEAARRGIFVDGTQRWVVEWCVLTRLGRLRLVSVWSRSHSGGPARLISSYLKEVKR
jgi:hypothetical protein